MAAVTQEPSKEQEVMLCGCGCGHRTKVALSNNSTKGQVKGKYFRFIHGHASRRGAGKSGDSKPGSQPFGNYKPSGPWGGSRYVSLGSLARNLSILSESFILPGQMQGEGSYRSGCQRLALALIEGAVRDLISFHNSQKISDKRIFLDAQEWVLGSSLNGGMLSLELCLGVLQVDPSWFRAQIQAVLRELASGSGKLKILLKRRI